MVERLIKAIWILFLPFSCFGCTSQDLFPDGAAETRLPASVAEQDVPVAIVSLEEKIVKFECLDARDECIPDLDITDYALIQWPYRLGPVYYCNASSIFLILYSSSDVPWEKSVIHYNPQTKEIKSTTLPEELEFLNSTTVGERLILAGDFKDTIYILDENLSTQKTRVGSPINKLIGANNRQVIALHEQPIEKNGEYFVEAHVINVVSGKSTKKQVRLPGLILRNSQVAPAIGSDVLINIEGLSRDMKYLYCLFSRGDEQEMRLGTFDLEKSKEIASTQDPNLIPLTTGYAQYRDFLYANRTLIDMFTVSSLLDYGNNPELKQGKQLIPVPFGEFFLLDLINHAVFRMSQSGEVLEEYPLPEGWIDKDYRVMYYTN